MFFQDFKPFTIEVQSSPSVSIFGRRTSSSKSHTLPPLLLLHGFPQSHHCWHRVAPALTSKYNVVVMDLRGYGESSKPEPVSQYAKSLMARDCVVVMSALGFESFFVCAHDRGARVAHKLCVDYPQHIRKAIFLDICPALDMYPYPTFDLAKTYFHWFFLIQKEPFPETLIASNARKSAEMFLAGGEGSQLIVFDKECLEYYIDRLSNDTCIHGMCQDYRASASIDLDEARKDEKKGKKFQCQLLILWSKNGLLQRPFEPLKLWGAMAMDPGWVSGRAVDSGHFIPESAPLEVINAMEEFLR
ncbi:hypothetical protein FDECE_4101 [Fusarium decemcellulare]|nr:hypothetical protein FDECE_4101 [Fusarium decemcellulare]